MERMWLCPNYQPNTNAPNAVKLFVVASAYEWCADHKAHNADSLILKITHGKISTLITGDFELTKNNMENFLYHAGNDLRSHIYKLSHHGALKANQKQFLDAIDAKYVFSSSGYRYGHPRCEIFEYYANSLVDTKNEHLYTCFNSFDNSPVRYLPSKHITKKPIYVTSVLYGDNEGWTDAYNMVVMFSIGWQNYNNIHVTLPPLGNEIPYQKKYPKPPNKLTHYEL